MENVTLLHKEELLDAQSTSEPPFVSSESIGVLEEVLSIDDERKKSDRDQKEIRTFDIGEET